MPMQSTPAAKQMSNLDFARWLVVVNGAVPLALLIWDAVGGDLGANPESFALHTTGLMALIFLCLTLLVTPLRVVTGLNWLVLFRRSLGLYAFFYACAHFSIFFIWDRALSIPSTIHEIATRVYLIIGTLALVLMIPLAVTSTGAMVKRLGSKRWHLLHELIYLSIIAGAVHFYMQAKSDKRLPTAFLVVVTILLGYRFVAHYFKLWRDAGAKPTAPSAAKAVARRPKFWTGQLRIARKFDETPSVRTFRLVPTDGTKLPFDYAAGQYLSLSVLIDGKRVNRSYTIASSPTRVGYCELTVKREETGAASRHLHDMLKEGELLNISAPAGRFTFTGSEADSIVLIGGGVGITPLMSVVRYLTDRCFPGDIFLIYAVKTQADIIFRRELSILEERFPNLHVTITLSREPDGNWTGARGRITRELLTRAVPEISGRLIHLCGPEDMMPPVQQMLRELGVPPSQIRTEVFQSGGQLMAESVPTDAPAPPTAQDPTADSVPTSNGDGAQITFALSGKTASAKGSTVLETAEEAGVPINFECRSGICGTCKTRLLSGRVEMETRDALSAADVANHLILACQAKPVEDITVSA
jgi:ferredoxin-NADP reductase/DMSO/TMAO reductase YedYZ heme-binding membrane subunit